MKKETSPNIKFDNFVALRSESFSFSYKNNNQKSKQKGIQHTPINQFVNSTFNSQTTTATKNSIRSDAHNLIVQKQDKLALNPSDDNRVYLNPIQSLSWDKHTQKRDFPRIYCWKLIVVYYKEVTENCKTNGEIYYSIWILKENLNHQQLLNLISDWAHLL